MKRRGRMAVLVGLLCMVPGSAFGYQMASATTLHWGAVDGNYDSVTRSIVRLHTVAQVERPADRAHRRDGGKLRFPLTGQGLGIVIDAVYQNGRREYVILTNNHVADLNPYLEELTAQLRRKHVKAPTMSVVEAKTYVVRGVGEEASDRIRTVLVARDARGDMALLRTVGAERDLAVFPYDIGVPAAGLETQTPVVAGVLRDGTWSSLTWGRITGVRYHTLGLPHTDYTVSLPLRNGQSGNPVFVVEPGDESAGGPLKFTLVGLMHAREKGVPYMVPFSLWKGTLCETPTGKQRSSHCTAPSERAPAASAP